MIYGMYILKIKTAFLVENLSKNSPRHFISNKKLS